MCGQIFKWNGLKFFWMYNQAVAKYFWIHCSIVEKIHTPQIECCHKRKDKLAETIFKLSYVKKFEQRFAELIFNLNEIHTTYTLS